VIVRIVNDFMESDFSRVVYDANMSDNQKLKNLDILRWNQVWLKTMKGEVIFYSHLSSVADSLQEGQFVKSGQKLWKIGVSWVPEAGYDDYHLHFAIMKNPYNASRAGSYDFGDYMSWDWQTKWLDAAQTAEAQKKIFQ
jgi:murein DD-endopeptidase MepM/ murein hydrolase activator NlpD